VRGGWRECAETRERQSGKSLLPFHSALLSLYAIFPPHHPSILSVARKLRIYTNSVLPSSSCDYVGVPPHHKSHVSPAAAILPFDAPPSDDPSANELDVENLDLSRDGGGGTVTNALDLVIAFILSM
jgi:hypothetical protein